MGEVVPVIGGAIRNQDNPRVSATQETTQGAHVHTTWTNASGAAGWAEEQVDQNTVERIHVIFTDPEIGLACDHAC